MDEEIDWTLLGTYLFGECSEEEASRVQEWTRRDPKRKVLLSQLRKILQVTEEPASAEDLNAQALWERIDRETREDKKQRVSSTKSSTRTPNSSHSKRRWASRPRSKESSLRKLVWTGSLAALITVTAALWLFGPLESGLQGSPSRSPKTFETQKGQRTSLRLTDGSQVRLNVDSRLTVSPNFGEEKRVVQLEGEAFFEVRSDSTRPFIVRSGGTAAYVLGTAFNVGAYPEEDKIKVAVVEGLVSLDAQNSQSSQEETAQEVVLTKNQVSLISRNGERVIQRDEDLSEHLAWIDGQLVFRDAPFGEVVRRLERWYDLKITLEESTTTPPGQLNARFVEDRPLADVLRVIDAAFGLKHERMGNRVTFSTVR